MILESGMIIFLGMLLLAWKLPLRISMRMLGRPFVLDLSVTIIAYIMHMGSMTGVMAAAVAGLMASGFTSLARYVFGYVRGGIYYPGKIWPIAVEKLK